VFPGWRARLVEHKQEGEEGSDVLGESIVTRLVFLDDGANRGQKLLTDVRLYSVEVAGADHLGQGAEALPDKVCEGVDRLLAALLADHLTSASVPTVVSAANGRVSVVAVLLSGLIVHLVHGGKEIVVAGGLVLATSQHLLVDAWRVLQEFFAIGILLITETSNLVGDLVYHQIGEFSMQGGATLLGERFDTFGQIFPSGFADGVEALIGGNQSGWLLSLAQLLHLLNAVLNAFQMAGILPALLLLALSFDTAQCHQGNDGNQYNSLVLHDGLLLAGWLLAVLC